MSRVTVVTVIFMAACTQQPDAGQDPESRYAKLGTDPARRAVADIYCTHMMACSPTSFYEGYAAGVGQCSSDAASWLLAPSEDPTDCIASLELTSCDDERPFDHACLAWSGSR